MTSSFTSVPLSFDDNNNKTNKTNNMPSSRHGHPHQQDNNMYSNSRPVETPPSASFSSGIQFQRALNPNPDTADRWGNGNNSLVGPNAPTATATTAAASSSSSRNRGSSFLRSKAQRDSVSSWRMNDPKQTQEAATRSTSTTFGFSAPSLSHEKSSILPTGYNPTSTSAMPSSSMLGLRQRRGAGNPPPKRSMMTMKIEMNTNKSLEELALTKGMNLTATSKAAATTTTGTENLDDSLLLSDYNKENDFMGNTSSIVPAIASKPTSSGTFLFAQNSTTQQEPQKQQPQQETRQQQHASTHPFHSGQLEYSRWVVLYGFTSPSQCLSILRVFGKFGTIVSKYPSHPRESSAANWMCVQYESSLQADKALCQHGTFLDVSNQVTILGVMRMDQVVAERLGLIHYWMNGVQEETVTTEYYYTQGEKDSMKKDASVTKDSGIVLKTTTLSESDVLLTNKERIKKRIGGGRQQDIGNALLESSQSQGLLYKILAWFFEW